MAIKYLIFDLDDTLMDFQKAEEKALSHTMGKLYPKEMDREAREAYHRINSRLWKDLERGLIQSPGVINYMRFQRLIEELPCDTHYEDAGNIFWQVLGEQRHMVEGAEEILVHLAGEYTLSILTNGIHKIQQRRFKGSAIEKHVSLIQNSEELGVSKPHPRIFDFHLEALGNPDRSEVLMIGDSLGSDMAGAKASGIRGCWFNPKGLPMPEENAPEYQFSRWDDFIPLLRQID